MDIDIPYLYAMLIRLSEQISMTTIWMLVVAAIALVCEKIRPARKTTPFVHAETYIEIVFAYVMVLALWPMAKLIIDFFFLEAMQSSPLSRLSVPYIESWPVAVQVLICVFLMDLVNYATHRFMHAFGWPYHSVHHEAENVNWSTNWRVHPVDAMMSFVSLFVMDYIGFESKIIVYAAFVANFCSSFSHFNVRLDWGFPFRYILMSPNFHHWHHAKKKEAVDMNFCVVFPLIDLLFGTFYCPKETPEKYGNFGKSTGPKLRHKLFQPFAEHAANLKRRWRKEDK